ncbi:MAG: hypothetical protein EBT71_06210, partial [Alphaproteobacteria bacterium]|nr:hypothetical protein [Alphaproteobacteria bacterium]
HRFDVSRERIRQIETRAFEKLRKAMTEQALTAGVIDPDMIEGETGL